MSKSCVAFMVLALSAACTSQDNPYAGVETGDDDSVIDALFSSWDVPGAPGCSISVSQNGELVYARGYGYANLDYDIPNTPQTSFDIASITKQFVAASLNMLEKDGRLSLDDDVREWLPELPEYEWPITLRHMIYHTSGLRDYLNLFPLSGRDDFHPISHMHILDMMSRQRALNFRPGERYLYSNTAYMLLALVIERASGQSLEEFVQERIYDPLGMDGSLLYDNFEEIMPRRAIGYAREDDGRVRMVHNFNFDVAGDGQMYSTVEDLLRWNDFLLGADKPDIYVSMLTEGALNNGDPLNRAMGLFLFDYRGMDVVYHTGSSWGFRSALVQFIEPGLAIAIACNDDNSGPWRMALKVADHYLADQLGPLGKDEEPEQQAKEKSMEPPTLTLAELGEFAGTYFSFELDATYRFAVVDSGLVVRIEQEQPINVAPVAEDQFEFEFCPQGWDGPNTVSLAFYRDDAGLVVGFGLSSDAEQNIMFEKHQPRFQEANND